MTNSDKSKSPPKVVMVFSGLDPTGGAGLQADIEALVSMGCHPAPIASCLTVQTTSDIKEVVTVDAGLIESQARAVLEDMPVHAFKLGLIPDIETIKTVAGILEDYPEIPVVLDPVIAAGGGHRVLAFAVLEAMLEWLIPKTTLITPNSEEAMRLIHNADTLDACAMGLLSQGVEYVLITGGHLPGKKVENTLYGNHRKLQSYSWDRLGKEYHGSGCTLASAIAGLLSQGQDVVQAIHAAQRYTWRSLNAANQIGMGQLIPDRFYWTGSNEH